MRINGDFSGKVKKGEEKSTKVKFKEEFGVFEQKARERIENGEPVYTMGMTSMTETDWEDLMKNIDSYMEKARKLNEVQYEKISKESLEQKFYDRMMVLTKEK